MFIYCTNKCIIVPILVNNFMNIALIIEKRRKFLKLTQSRLAELAGVSLRSLKAIESGKGNPTISQLAKILDVLGMKITVELQ